MMDDDIRCAYLTELGLWMMECPELYMEDSYLNYLGWPLQDKAVHAQHGGGAGQDEEAGEHSSIEEYYSVLHWK